MWRNLDTSLHELLTHEESSCAIAIPRNLTGAVHYRSHGSHYYGIMLGDLILVSIHITDHSSNGNGAKTFDEVVKFVEHAKSQTPVNVQPMVFVVGDFNVTLPKLSDDVVGKFVMDPLPSHKLHMQNFVLNYMSRLQLYAPATFLQSRPGQMWTRANKTQTKLSQIDYVLCQHHNVSHVSNLSWPTSLKLHSDHKPIWVDGT